MHQKRFTRGSSLPLPSPPPPLIILLPRPGCFLQLASLCAFTFGLSYVPGEDIKTWAGDVKFRQVMGERNGDNSPLRRGEQVHHNVGTNCDNKERTETKANCTL